MITQKNSPQNYQTVKVNKLLMRSHNKLKSTAPPEHRLQTTWEKETKCLKHKVLKNQEEKCSFSKN